MKELERMSLSELWDLFPIVLTEHNPEWKSWAQEEASLLVDTLFPLAPEIHHIGSTAVAAIKAKPIIDLIVAFEDASSFPEVRRRLEAAGYICMSAAGQRMSFNKGYTPQGYAERVFHIHLRVKSDIDEIRFRDYLNANPDVAREYEALKLSLYERYAPDRDAYTRAKTPFVTRITRLAKTSIIPK